MVKMVVFDMAGTTVDEDNVVYKTLQSAIIQQGIEVSFEHVLIHGAGKEKRKATEDILSSLNVTDPSLADTIYNTFLDQLQKAYQELDVKEQVGAKQLFSSLKAKGIKVVLNTGYNADTANSLLQKLNWTIGEAGDIDALITASDVPQNRPYPDMIYLAMERLGISQANEVVKIGDSIIDIEEGKNAGCSLTIGITTGAHSREQLESAKPDFIVDNLEEIIPLIS
jgi:phosphonatase-like hydrolase